MPADRCDVPGCADEPKFFHAGTRRCLAHVPRDEPGIRSDVPVECRRCRDLERLCDAYRRDYESEIAGAAEMREQFGARSDEIFPDFVRRLHSEYGGVRRLRARVAFLEIARAEAVRAAATAEYGADSVRENLRVTIALMSEWTARALTAEARIAEAVRCLTRWPADGAFVLRKLKGETT